VTTKIRLKEFGLLPRRIRLLLKARREMKTFIRGAKKTFKHWKPLRWKPLFHPDMRTSYLRPTSEDIYGSVPKYHISPMEYQGSIMKFGSIMDDFEDSVDAALDEIEKSVAKLPEKDREVQARILWKDQRHQFKKPTENEFYFPGYGLVTAEDMAAESELDDFENLMKSHDKRSKHMFNMFENWSRQARDKAGETS